MNSDYIDFDDQAVYFYRDKLFMRLSSNGYTFFQVTFDLQNCEFYPLHFIEIAEEDWEQLTLLPHTTEVIFQYVQKTNSFKLEF